LARLKKAELEGISIEVEKFNKAKLRRLIPTFRELTLKEPSEFYPELKRLCSNCGVALVLVEDLRR
jgi:HTH-type transcriptional regulator/antitoxin HigA